MLRCALRLHETASATRGTGDTYVDSYVLSSQEDVKRKTPFEVNEARGSSDPVDGRYHIHHTREDKLHGVRAHYVDTLPVTKCHEDVQICDSEDGILEHRKATWSILEHPGAPCCAILLSPARCAAHTSFAAVSCLPSSVPGGIWATFRFVLRVARGFPLRSPHLLHALPLRRVPEQLHRRGSESVPGSPGNPWHPL